MNRSSATRRQISASLTAGLVLLVAGIRTAYGANGPGAEEIEFFEKKIRPVLVERCFKCHSATSEKLKGHLRLDSREDMLKGGDTRAAIVPGDPEKSLLVEAIRYTNQDLQMPPKIRLTNEQVADFIAWIKNGAHWPAESAEKKPETKEGFDLAKRRSNHWAWKIIQTVKPPAVKDSKWIRNSVDPFVLAKLEANALRPAPPADKRTLIRRLSFDLIGLPPTPHETEEFLSDNSDLAYENLVDRLLGSPRFGERWARHWLDLVRYSETLGHEFDYSIPNAWRYRDYLIRALNADVPYDRLVIEHLAGDLLAKPRINPTEHFNESIIGTSFFWFGQQTHSPVDVRQHQADVIENQIDVLTKTFLGLTVACARCHDHKFDAISTRDFYSLYGILESSRYAQRSIQPIESDSEKIERLKSLKSELQLTLRNLWRAQASNVAKYLCAAREVSARPAYTCDAAAAKFGLDGSRLERWISALGQRSVTKQDHPLFAWRQLSTTNVVGFNHSFEDRWVELLSPSKPRNEINAPIDSHYFSFADFRTQDYRDWFVDGGAFGSRPVRAGDWLVGDKNQPVALLLRDSAANSGAISLQLQGALRSRDFTITNRFAHFFVAGRDSRINVVVDNFELIQSPIYGSLRQVVDHDQFRWLTIDLSMWLGQRAYFELSDISTPDLAGGGKPGGYGPNGFIAVNQILLSDEKSPPLDSDFSATAALFPESSISSIQTLAHEYQQATIDAIDDWATDGFADSNKGRARFTLLDWLVRNHLLDAISNGTESKQSSDAAQSIAKLVEEFHHVEATIRIPDRAPAMAEGEGFDERVFVRGSPKNLGENVPRRFLEGIAGADQPRFEKGSGRLQLAQRMTDRSNPFLARVAVNRVWHHLFGRGIVPTPDDFGVLGQPPTHPELLDWLASYFRDEAGWSIKKLIRLLVTSATYRMSSRPLDSIAEEKDPDNLLIHRMPVRRVEGEVIRDAMLAVSGRLDTTMFGPSVPVHLNEFMEGRGRPSKSGPLDGADRRSIYLEVRRNFLSPMIRTFDAPVPFTTVGKRTVSNVPAQSLILMNDLFVIGQAREWSKRLLSENKTSAKTRIEQVFQSAFGRPPSPKELAEALDFLKLQASSYGPTEAEPSQLEKTWADFCHVIFNVKEFVFIN